MSIRPHLDNQDIDNRELSKSQKQNRGSVVNYATLFNPGVETLRRDPYLWELIVAINSRETDQVEEVLEKTEREKASERKPETIPNNRSGLGALISLSPTLLPDYPIEYAFEQWKLTPAPDMAYLEALVRHRKQVNMLIPPDKAISDTQIVELAKGDKSLESIVALSMNSKEPSNTRSL
ncbi:CBU_1198 family Dot/Icm T4SS effector [Coxiella burnetii]|uniref:CBU_1198 family Dot/Icm T4SS effector n=1 Tax=Coxiella burnetii TaxID=777 RepID=UPI000CCBE7FD|nr:CBU_1198 family Dot/Icm T4SS effector [Coxiella burnetii]PNT87479.1 hypothetical protein C2L89_08860 [Coxiella burnetii]